MITQPEIDILQITNLVMEVALKSAVILGAACLLARCLRAQSAAIRVTIYSTGIILTLAFIVAAPLMPRWTVSLPQWVSLTPVSPAAVENQVINAAIDAPSASVSTVLTFAGAVIWVVVSGALSLRFFKSLLGLRQLRTASDPEDDVQIHRLIENVAERLQAPQRTITVLQNRSIGVPITWGCLRHTVLLPHHFNELPFDSQRMILTHEIVHIARRDFAFRTLAELLCILLWFQPLSWTVRRRLCEEQERVSDDHVLSIGERASGYARLLLECHDRLSIDYQLPIALGIVERNSFRSRIDAILDSSISRRPVTLTGLVFVFSVATTLLFPLTMLSVSTPAETVVEKVETGDPSVVVLAIGSHSETPTLGKNETDMIRATTPRSRTSPQSDTQMQPLSRSDTEPKTSAARQASPDQPGAATARTQEPELIVEEIKAPAAETRSPRSSTVKSPPRGASEMVERVFDNIRHGFKNGKTPVTVLEP